LTARFRKLDDKTIALEMLHGNSAAEGESSLQRPCTSAALLLPIEQAYHSSIGRRKIMPVTVKHISLWRKEIENQVGTLASTLDPVAKAGANLRVLMGYRYPGNESRAAIELYPVSGTKATAAATAAGLAASSIPAVLIEGDDKPGLGLAIAKAIADTGINMAFFVAQVVGRKYSAVIGFDSEADAKTAADLIKKATGRKKR
jgi:hypothetical protein